MRRWLFALFLVLAIPAAAWDLAILHPGGVLRLPQWPSWWGRRRGEHVHW